MTMDKITPLILPALAIIGGVVLLAVTDQVEAGYTLIGFGSGKALPTSYKEAK